MAFLAGLVMREQIALREGAALREGVALQRGVAVQQGVARRQGAALQREVALREGVALQKMHTFLLRKLRKQKKQLSFFQVLRLVEVVLPSERLRSLRTVCVCLFFCVFFL